jgi:hypothetical protein
LADGFEVVLVKIGFLQLVRVVCGIDLDLDDILGFVGGMKFFAAKVARHMHHGDYLSFASGIALGRAGMTIPVAPQSVPKRCVVAGGTKAASIHLSHESLPVSSR